MIDVGGGEFLAVVFDEEEPVSAPGDVACDLSQAFHIDTDAGVQPVRRLEEFRAVEGETELFGTDLEETRAFAAKALERRLKVIGLAPVA